MEYKSIRHGSSRRPGPMVVGEEGSSGVRTAVALCVMYWLLLSYPLTLAVTCLGTLLVTALVYLKRLLRTRDCMARLTCRDSALSRHLATHCHALRRALLLPAWARHHHVQTCLGLLAARPGAQFARQYMELRDGGMLALDWAAGTQYLRRDSPLLILLPDLPCSAVQLSALCCEALTLGMKPVVVNRRGQGNSMVSTPRLPGYGDTGDLREVVEYLERTHRGAGLCALGVGTGGDAVLSYLGQYGSSCRLSVAVCISPSYSGAHTLHALCTPYLQLYLSHLKRIVLNNARVFGSLVQLVRRTWSVKDFDARITTTCGGFRDLEEFWEHNEPLRDADEISVPVLCVSSLDDPVCRSQHIPYDLFRALPNFFLLTLTHGGHAGFRSSLAGPSWAEAAGLDFILAMLSFQHNSALRHVSVGTQTSRDDGEMADWDLEHVTEDCGVSGALPRTLPAEWHG